MSTTKIKNRNNTKSINKEKNIKQTNHIRRVMEQKYTHMLWPALTVIGFWIYAGFLMLQSPNSIVSKVPEYIDSGVFQYLGKGILEGRVPYVDAFDHKGPILYLLNALGFLIGGRSGIWVLEWFILFAAMIASYKMCRIFFSRFGSVMAVLLTYSLLAIYLKGGNFTEEYAMLPIAVALYIFARYFKEGKTSRLQLIVLGASCMVTLLLKVNVAGVWVVFCGYLVIASVLKKEFRELGQYILYFLVGALVVFIPVALWLILAGAWSDFVYSYISFNMVYVKAKGGMAMLDAVKFFLDGNTRLILLLGIFAPIWTAFKDRRKFVFVLLNSVYLLLAFVLMVMPGNHYIHYGLYYMPAVLVPTALVFHELEGMARSQNGAAVCASAVLGIYLVNQIGVTNMIAQIDEIALTTQVSAEKTQLVDAIQRLTDEEDKIIVLGNECWIYNYADREAVNKYIFQHPLVWISQEISDEYNRMIEEEPPALMVAQGDGSSDELLCQQYKCELKEVYGPYRIYTRLSGEAR